MLADPLTSQNLSKVAIVEWVNASIDPNQSFSCVKDIPSKVAAAFMNDIFGDAAFSMRGVNFFDGWCTSSPSSSSASDSAVDFQINRRNCDAVLEGASLLGFQATFTGQSWADGVKDFGGVLLFWRWLRQKSLEKPLSRCMPAAELGLVPSSSGVAATNSAAIASGNQSGGLSEHSNSAGNNRQKPVVRLSDVHAAAIAGGCGPNTENAAPSSSSQQQPLGAASAGAPFLCGGPNGDIAKQLFEANYKELTAMRKHHDELTKAIADGNLHKIVAVLQQGHHGL